MKTVCNDSLHSKLTEYQKTFMRIYPKVVSLEGFYRGSSHSSSGFPIGAFGNDRLLEGCKIALTR